MKATKILTLDERELDYTGTSLKLHRHEVMFA